MTKSIWRCSIVNYVGEWNAKEEAISGNGAQLFFFRLQSQSAEDCRGVEPEERKFGFLPFSYSAWGRSTRRVFRDDSTPKRRYVGGPEPSPSIDFQEFEDEPVRWPLLIIPLRGGLLVCCCSYRRIWWSEIHCVLLAVCCAQPDHATTFSVVQPEIPIHGYFSFWWWIRLQMARNEMFPNHFCGKIIF